MDEEEILRVKALEESGLLAPEKIVDLFMNEIKTVIDNTQIQGRNVSDTEFEMYIDHRTLVITITESVLFMPGKITLHPKVFPMLDKLGELLLENYMPVTVRGHTDPARGQISNWELSGLRATSVYRHLVEGVRMAPQLVFIEGVSSHWPAPRKPGERLTARHNPRRIDLIINKGDIEKRYREIRNVQ